MENDSESYEDILWNKYDQLQKRLVEKSMYYQSSIKYFKEVYAEVERHIIQLTLIDNEIKLKKPTKLDELFNIFKNTMNLFLDNHKKLINKIVKNLQEYLSSIKKENPVYNDFKQSFHNYQLEQKKFNQIKEKFHESALEAETKTLKRVQKKNEKKTNELVDLSNKQKKEVGNKLKKYQISLNEINKKREEYNSKQTSLIKYYVDIEKNELNMYYSILNDFLKIELEKTIKHLYQPKINELSEKNRLKNIDKECQENLKKLKSNEKPEEKISFEYKSNIDFDKCLEKEDFDTYAETVGIIKKNFNHIYEGITLEKEKLKNNIRELIKRFFELDKTDKINDIKIDEEKLYFDSLNDTSTHTTFIKLLTKLRTNSKFNRHKKLIEILGRSFKIILDEAEKNNNFWIAKNCIILSQTFYYEEEFENKKKIKKYAFEYIKTDSWLIKKDFWIGYTFYMVEEELKKFVKLFPDIDLEDIKNNKDFNSKQNLKISDVIFSQLLPSITNMLEITKKNMYAIEIIELFHEQYKYLTEDKMETLFLLTKAGKEDIERMRNEYIFNKRRTTMENEEKIVSINKINGDKQNVNIDKINDASENNKNNMENKNEKINMNINNKKENDNLIIIENTKDDNKIKDFHLINSINIKNNNKINNENIIDNINIIKNEKEVDINNANMNKNLIYINYENNIDIKNNNNNLINSFKILEEDENTKYKINQNLNDNNILNKKNNKGCDKIESDIILSDIKIIEFERKTEIKGEDKKNFNIIEDKVKKEIKEETENNLENEENNPNDNKDNKLKDFVII